MAKKKFKLLSAFLAKGHLLRVSRQSCPSANDKGDNEMIPVAVYRSPGICRIAEETPGKTLARGPSKKAVRLVIASNGVPYSK